VRLRSITVCGFRAFGSTAQTIELAGTVTVVAGPNSAGKSSLVEAIEFLLAGRTTRQQLHAGAKSEFAGCLRNVHLQKSAAVWVEATVDIDGQMVAMRRELLADIDSHGDFRTALTVGGKIVSGVADIGVRLAAVPFETPVLMQHSLRYVLSEKPQVRSDYLKTVLEIADLDTARDMIARVVQSLPVPQTPARALLGRCRAVIGAGTHLTAGVTSSADVTAALLRVFRTLLDDRDDGATLLTLAARMRGELSTRREAVFSLDAFRAAPVGGFAPSEMPSLSAAKDGGAAPPVAPPSVLALLRSVRELEPTVDAPRDCPVCLTPLALTPDRLREIGAFLDAHVDAVRMGQDARNEVATMLRETRALRGRVNGAAPRAAYWKPQDLQREAAAAASVHDEGAALVSAMAWHAAEIVGAQAATGAAIDSHEAALMRIDEALRSGAAFDLTSAHKSARSLHDAVALLDAAAAKFLAATADARTQLSQTQATRSNTAGWDLLVQLVDVLPAIDRENEAQLIADVLTKDCASALREIDVARKSVLDANFATLSTDVERWWSLLRMDEPIRFASLRRRGEGNRFVDLKAMLEAEVGAGGFERDAAGVFSDSQLNALGLAIFLARATRSGLGFVVLDDPVPASDDEHCGSFASQVIGALLDDGVQVVVTTHNRKLARTVHDLHGHRSLSGYEVTLDSPRDGSRLAESSDELGQLLHDAEGAARHATSTLLREAAQKVRIAAERLCKSIIVVQQRAEGKDASVTDLRGTLGELLPMVIPLLVKDPSHAGKLRHAGKVLNPGNHDDTEIPGRADLVMVVGDLKGLRKEYCPRPLRPATQA
jgi:ABC-type Mn2+/Zn2+ transport system ATPase subunit